MKDMRGRHTEMRLERAIAWLARELVDAQRRARELEATLARLCQTRTPHGLPDEVALGTLITVEERRRERRDHHDLVEASPEDTHE